MDAKIIPINDSVPADGQWHLVSEKVMAGMLSISARQLRNFRTRALIPFVKLGKSVRYSPPEVRSAIVTTFTVQSGTPPKRAA